MLYNISQNKLLEFLTISVKGSPFFCPSCIHVQGDLEKHTWSLSPIKYNVYYH